jgi:hypothetical protein
MFSLNWKSYLTVLSDFTWLFLQVSNPEEIDYHNKLLNMLDFVLLSILSLFIICFNLLIE